MTDTRLTTPEAATRPARRRPGPPSPETRPMQAAVTAHGSLVEIEDGRGARFLARHPLIADTAANLLAAGRERVAFVFVAPDRIWHSVRIEAVAEDEARVTVQPIAPPFGLTLRELDIATLIAGGLSNQQMADRLSTSLRTITTHVERVLDKAGVASRAGLAGLASELGLMRLPLPGGVALPALTIGLVDGPRPARAAVTRLRRRPIRIGAPLSLSAFGRADASEMLNGATLAIEEINRIGGVGGRELELHVVDCDVSDAAAVERAYHRLIEDEVDAITGGYNCAEDRVQHLVADYGAPYLHCTTMEAVVDRVRQDPGRLGNIFQTGPTDIHYGPQFADFVLRLAASGEWRPRNRRIAVIQPSWSLMDIGLEALEAKASRKGWTVDTVTDLPLTGIDWPAVLRRIHHLDPAVILLAYYFPEESVAFQRSFAAEPFDSLVYTLYGPSVPLYREALGEMAEGVVWATTTGTYADGLGRDFAARYAARHGRAPGRAHAGLAYDRVNLLATAWARAGNPRAFGRVVQELRRTVHRGVSGAYCLDNPGQCGLSYPDVTPDPSIGQAHLTFQIQGGRNAILGPAPYADGAFRLPPWFGSGG